MRVLVSGASGLIGSAVVKALRTEGWTAVPLVRRSPAAGEVRWDPASGEIGADALSGIDAVVHLAAESISGRWTAKKKELIRDTRVRGTRTLAEAVARATQKPQAFVFASAIGFYGDRGDESLTEQSPAGPGFLPEVCQAWEDAAEPARGAGVRTVPLRFGIVLTKAGGALQSMLPPFRMGVGGRLGSGRQWMSYLSREDAAGMVVFALKNAGLSGPANAVTGASRNLDFTRALGRALKRPTIFPLPAFAARLMFGEMADGLLLASAKVEPALLQRLGYEPRHPTLDQVLAAGLADAS